MSDWPSNIEPKSEDEWLALATSNDAKEQQQVGATLKKLGYGAREFVRWSPEERVQTILKHQPEGGGSKKSSSKTTKSRKGAASKRSKSSTTAKSKGSASSAKSEAPASGGGLGAEGLKLLKAILEGVEANAQKLEELEAEIEELKPFIKETHYGFSCIALGDEAIANNFEDPSVQEELYGSLTVEGGDDEDDDEGEE